MMLSPRVLVDLGGVSLTVEDREFLAHPSINGVILFTRNFESLEQLSALTHSIHDISKNLMIIVDQEGGRVQRFRDGFTTLPAMRTYGELFKTNPYAALEALKKNTTIMIRELQAAGITTSLVPVLDVDYGFNEVIGERSFGNDPEMIATLAKTMIDVLRSHQAFTTVKHFPGHGYVSVDSHKELPVDDRDLETIKNSDLIPFIKLLHEYDCLMPGHIVFKKVDDRPVGFSPVWLKDILRKQFGYKGRIMTDDLSMEAAVAFGDYRARAEAAVDAGCDLLLVCNNRSGAEQVVSYISKHHSKGTV